MVKCYTCGVEKPWKGIQNGHFVSRTYLSTRFDPRNCRPQCVGCNLFGNGKPVEFAYKLELEQPGITNELYREARRVIRYFPYDSAIEACNKVIADKGWG